MRFPRRVGGVTRKNTQRNDKIWCQLQIQSLLQFVEPQQMGPLVRPSPKEIPLKEVWLASSKGKKSRKISNETWKTLKTNKETMGEVTQKREGHEQMQNSWL